MADATEAPLWSLEQAHDAKAVTASGHADSVRPWTWSEIASWAHGASDEYAGRSVTYTISAAASAQTWSSKSSTRTRPIAKITVERRKIIRDEEVRKLRTDHPGPVGKKNAKREERKESGSGNERRS